MSLGRYRLGHDTLNHKAFALAYHTARRARTTQRLRGAASALASVPNCRGERDCLGHPFRRVGDVLASRSAVHLKP